MERILGDLISERNHKRVYVHDGIITKVFDHNFYHGYNVMREASIQQFVMESGLPVPKVYDVFQVGDDWAFTSQEIKGRTLESIIEADPEHKKQHVVKMLQAHIRLLSKLCKNNFLPDLKAKVKRYIEEASLDSSQRYDIQLKLEKFPNHLNICHGDIYPHNIMVTDDGTFYILDWAHCSKGNATADIVNTYLMFLIDGEPKIADIYLREFSKKSYTSMSYIKGWVAVLSAAYLTRVNDEKKKEILLKNIDSVTY